MESENLMRNNSSEGFNKQKNIFIQAVVKEIVTPEYLYLPKELKTAFQFYLGYEKYLRFRTMSDEVKQEIYWNAIWELTCCQ